METYTPKVGDKVRLIKRLDDNVSWVSSMDKYDQTIGTVRKVSSHKNITIQEDSGNWNFGPKHYEPYSEEINYFKFC